MELKAASFFDYDIYYCGAKGLGAGGAYTAVADGTSAVYWNPAGLVQQKNPVLTYMLDAKFILYDIRDIINSEFKVTYIPGLISLLWPLNDRHSVVFGISEYTPAQKQIKNTDSFSIYQISPHFAFIPFPDRIPLSIGVSPSLMLGWHPAIRSIATGFGVQAGIYFPFSEIVRWGMVFRSPYVMNWSEMDIQETFPMVIQTGLSFRLGVNFGLSADIEYQDWQGVKLVENGIEQPVPAFQNGIFHTFIPHLGVIYNHEKSGAHLRAGYMGRPYMDNLEMKVQHLMTFGISGVAMKVISIDAVLVDAFLLSFFYPAPIFQEIIQITVEYRF